MVGKLGCPRLCSSDVREALSTEHRVAVTVYALSTAVHYRTIGNVFGIVCVCIHFAYEAICAIMLHKIVNFLSGHAQEMTLVGMKKKDKKNFPNCAGGVDAKPPSR